MKSLWLVVVGLGLLYLAIWSLTKGPHGPAVPPQNQRVQQGSGPVLAEIARGDVVGRIDPQAKTEIVSVAPKRLAGDDLHEVPFAAPEGTVGFAIVIAAIVNEKQVARLTYHAAPPSKVVYVKTEQVR